MVDANTAHVHFIRSLGIDLDEFIKERFARFGIWGQNNFSSPVYKTVTFEDKRVPQFFMSDSWPVGPSHFFAFYGGSRLCNCACCSLALTLDRIIPGD